jgi:hypothetical protein
MDFKLDRIEDKVEFYEATTLSELERKINEQIDYNRAILLNVHSVSHHTHINHNTEQVVYSAVVHFKAKG